MRSVSERIDGHFHWRVAVRATDFKTAASSVGIVVRTCVDVRANRLCGSLAGHSDQTQLAQLLRELRHEIRMCRNESVIRDDFASYTSAPTIINYRATRTLRVVVASLG